MNEPAMANASGEAIATSGDVLEEVSRVIADLESHPDPVVREQIGAVLEGIDAVHRTGLSHLFNAIHGIGGDALINRLTADPAIRLLLMSYDLLAVDRRLIAEEALDAVRGHLHAHGVDVELLDVAGSEVFIKLHGIAESELGIEPVRRDVEAALAAGLIGFQELVIGDRDANKPAELIQLGGRRAVQRPVYRSACAAGDLPPGDMKPVEFDADSILVANVGNELYAVGNHCGESPLPLAFSTLDGAILTCSWHGCRYDLRSGARVDDPDAPRLRVYPVRVNDDMIEIAVGVEPVGPTISAAG